MVQFPKRLFSRTNSSAVAVNTHNPRVAALAPKATSLVPKPQPQALTKTGDNYLTQFRPLPRVGHWQYYSAQLQGDHQFKSVTFALGGVALGLIALGIALSDLIVAGMGITLFTAPTLPFFLDKIVPRTQRHRLELLAIDEAWKRSVFHRVDGSPDNTSNPNDSFDPIRLMVDGVLDRSNQENFKPENVSQLSQHARQFDRPNSPYFPRLLRNLAIRATHPALPTVESRAALSVFLRVAAATRYDFDLANAVLQTLEVAQQLNLRAAYAKKRGFENFSEDKNEVVRKINRDLSADKVQVLRDRYSLHFQLALPSVTAHGSV